MPKNLLTRLMRGAASFQFAGKPISFISTHAPHARRDMRIGEVKKTLEHLVIR